MPILFRCLVAVFFATPTIAVFAAPVLNEFMANNGHGIADADGNHSDWIEIYNPDTSAVDLSGYTLSDDENDPAKWVFPRVSLQSGAYLIVFASGKDRIGEELHSNFRLGETDTLILADALGTVVSSFEPTYPEQFEDVSYGVAQSGQKTTLTLVESAASGNVTVPTADLGGTWTSANFNDASWTAVTTGVGYENSSGYESLLGSGGNLVGALFGEAASLYLRVPFRIDDLTQLSELTLRMKYDDGFVAWINGVPVASENAPANPRWNAEATENHDDGSAVQFQEFDASAAIPRLRQGTNVLAIQGLNVGNDSSDMLIVPELDGVRVSAVQSGTTGYLERPTPGSLNGSSFGGFVSDTKFSVDRGFFEAPIEVEISTATEGAEIRYTTNGDEPTAASGTRYVEPVRISRSTTLRAAAFKAGQVSTNVDTVSYFFLNDIVSQSANGTPPVGWPNDGANGQEMNYGMDPDVVNGVHSPSEVQDALRAVPTLSIVTELDNLIGVSNGIYLNPGNDGRTWERAASIELMHSDGSKGFQIDGGIRIRGGFSRSKSNPKHSFRLFFRRDYGEGKLRYPMFGDEGADEFDNLDLRTSQNYSWAFGGDSRNTMLRDVFSRDVQGRMGHPYTRSRYYHLYLNGQYWGLYQTQERAEASFAETYFGGDKTDYDVIKSFGAVTDGTRDAHSRLWQEATAGFSSDARYWRVQGLNPNGTRNINLERLLDVDNLIDYMILTYYTGDRDGPGSRFTQPRPNNFYTIFNRNSPDGFKYFEHDSEHALGTGDNDMTFPFTTGSQVNNFNPHWLHEQLVANANYRQRFAELVYKRLFNGGLLSPNQAIASIEHRAAQIDQAIIAESARWGDSQRSTPYTRDTWLGAVSDLKQWVRSRRETLLGQLRARAWVPQTDPPELSPAPGPVAKGTNLLFRASGGKVFYTLDGSDPRDPGALEASPSGDQITVLASEGIAAKALVPSDAGLGTSWHSPAFNDASWLSGTTGVGYDENSDYRSLIGLDVNAVMNDKNTSVYVRVPFDVAASSAFTKLILKMKYDDGFAAFLNGTLVASANSPSALPWNAEATAGHGDGEATQFAAFDISEHLTELRSGANLLAIHGLNDGIGSSDMLITPQLEGVRTSGGSLVALSDGRIVVKARTRTGNEWSALSEGAFLVGGEPASSENLVLSEIMYHPAPASEAEAAAGFVASDFEYIELLNIGAVTIDLSELFFLRGVSFKFPDSTLLESGARGLLVRNLQAFQVRYGLNHLVLGSFSGALDDSGERLALVRTWDDPIRDLDFNDRGEWPAAADGAGRSLVLVEPASNPDPKVATNWLASLAPLGAPGEDDPGTTIIVEPEPKASYVLWKERLGVTNDLADPDSDGRVNVVEYAYGSLPFQVEIGSTLTVEAEGESSLLRHPVNLEATEARYTLQVSSDLVTWEDLELDPSAITDEALGPTRVSRRYEVPQSVGRFVRLRVTLDF